MSAPSRKSQLSPRWFGDPLHPSQRTYDRRNQEGRFGRRRVKLACACRFYGSKQEMEAAAATHDHPVLASMMPALLYRHADAALPLRSATIRAPCLAMQQGTTLCKWYALPRSEAEVRAMVCALAQHLTKLHASGLVHGSLRADLVLHMPDSDGWRVLGLQSAVCAGALQTNPGTCCAPREASW